MLLRDRTGQRHGAQGRFFFSSRRRHTRCSRDWSSDVCSSDLFAQATSGLKNERVVGVVVAYGGEVAWSDIFASGDLFDHYWRKLLRSYAVEALTRPTYRQAASRDNAAEFLRRFNGREAPETEPGVYRWHEIKEGQLAQIELDALQPKPITLHRLLLHRTS